MVDHSQPEKRRGREGRKRKSKRRARVGLV